MKYKVTLSIFAIVMLSLSAAAQVQKIMTLAGNGAAGFYGDGLNASGAQLWGPLEVSLDKAGNVYILDFNNYRIRKVNTAGVITTVAGNGAFGYSGDGSSGPSGSIFAYGMAVDWRNNIFFSDPGNHIIRKVNAFGILSRVAGSTVQGYSGDGGAATLARFNQPHGMCVDDKGNVYVADGGNHVIRKIDTFGKVWTVAGNGIKGNTGDMGPATMASLDSPYTVAVDHKGNIYINDFNNNRIRKVSVADGNIYEVTSISGIYGYFGDGGPATAATVNAPRGMCVDWKNNLYIADALNSVIRKIDTFGNISTVAGNGSMGFMGDLGFVTGANFHNPYGVAVDTFGNIYIADANNQRIRKTYSTVSVGAVTANAGIEAYPNPFSRHLSVSGLAKADAVAIMDMAGRVVSAWQVMGTGIQNYNIDDLSPGMYVLQVCDSEGNRKAQMKLVKE